MAVSRLGERRFDFTYRCECGARTPSKLAARIVFVQVDGNWRIADVIRGKDSARAILARYFSAK